MPTPFLDRVAILADLWLNFRDDEDFQEFISYNDLGLPLAFALNEKFVMGTDASSRFVNDTFEMLLKGLELDDLEKGWENLDEILAHGSGDPALIL